MNTVSVRVGPIGNQVIVTLTLQSSSPHDGAVVSVSASAAGPLAGAADVVLRASGAAARSTSSWQLVGAEGDAEPAAEPASSSSGPAARAEAARTPYTAQPKAAPAAAVAAAPAPAPWKPPRYYVITRVPEGSGLRVGIFKVHWELIAAHLPNGRLFGSGVRLWGYDTLADAEARWIEQRPDDAHPGLRVGSI